MVQLTRYDNDSIELAINTETGEVFASISAVARMTDKGETTIKDYVNGRFKRGREFELFDAEILTPAGLQRGRFLNEDQILELIVRYKPSLLVDFAKIGLRMGLQQLVGYKVTSELPGHAEVKVDGFLSIKEGCLDTAKQKAYNPTQGENAFNTMNSYLKNDLGFEENYTTALDATKTALMYSVATVRLMKEEDKSLQQNHLTNIMLKAGRQSVVKVYGQEAIPYEAYPKVEQKLIDQGKSPLDNISSKSKME
jgi:hypothetical protein